MSNEVVSYEGIPPALKPDDIKAQVALIQDVMKAVMRDNEHYGRIPGCGDKPTLLQPGAQKLIMTFRLVPDPEVTVIDLPNEHREYRVIVRLSTQNGICLGAGVGSCSTMEGKFRYRKADLICPECQQATIIKGKAEFGGGWICYQKKGGCGKKWTDADNPFGVIQAKTEHDNPADYYNTCEKMAYKRALVSATLTVTAASDIFTQDIEDMTEVLPVPTEGKDIKQPQSKSESAKETPAETELQTVTAIIEKVEKKDGKTNNKPWTKYFITAGGEQFCTFDKTIAEAAKEYIGQELCLDYYQTKYGKDLQALREPKAEGTDA